MREADDVTHLVCHRLLASGEVGTHHRHGAGLLVDYGREPGSAARAVGVRAADVLAYCDVDHALAHHDAAVVLELDQLGVLDLLHDVELGLVQPLLVVGQHELHLARQQLVEGSLHHRHLVPSDAFAVAADAPPHVGGSVPT
eukprot:scaffold6931_cov45-Phaeocystis_antarctica.AAC.2